MKTVLDNFGNWPSETEQARKEKRHLHITPDKAFSVIHGKEHPTKCTFFISNNRCHVGKFEICGGRNTDPETHKGDEILMVLKGSVQIVVLSELEDEAAVSRKAYAVEEGQKFLIPEGYKHQYFNLGKGLAEILFTIAPEL